MKYIFTRNLKEITKEEISNILKIEKKYVNKEETITLLTQNGQEFPLNRLPKVQNRIGGTSAYLQKGNREFLYKETKGFSYLVVIDQDIKYNKCVITDLYFIIMIDDNKSMISKLVSYNKDGITRILTENFANSFLFSLPFSEGEKALYAKLIKEFIDELNVTKATVTMNRYTEIKPSYSQYNNKIQDNKFVSWNNKKNTQNEYKKKRNMKKTYEYKGKTYSNLSDIANQVEISYGTLYNRLQKGMTVEEAINQGVTRKGGEQ